MEHAARVTYSRRVGSGFFLGMFQPGDMYVLAVLTHATCFGYGVDLFDGVKTTLLRSKKKMSKRRRGMACEEREYFCYGE
jgi:hypothetical protein